MITTEIQTTINSTTTTSTPTHAPLAWAGVSAFATHTPPLTPGRVDGYPSGATTPTAGPTHNRTALIGAAGVALLLAAMGGIAYARMQAADVTPAAPVVAVAAVPAAVPHGAAAELAATLAMSPTDVVTVSVPHAATAEFADSLADVPVVTVQPPHGAAPVQ